MGGDLSTDFEGHTTFGEDGYFRVQRNTKQMGIFGGYFGCYHKDCKVDPMDYSKKVGSCGAEGAAKGPEIKCFFCNDETPKESDWKPDVDPEAEKLAQKYLSRCNIERVKAQDMTTERFQKEFQDKKPFIDSSES